MPKYYSALSTDLQQWALAQPVFFTATAPTFGAHINVSPKGHTTSSFAITSPNTCAYLDATGSGCETAAHLRDNGRITLMWLSFGSSPRIMRLFGTGRVIERGDTGEKANADFEAAVQRMVDANGGKLDVLPVQKGKGNSGEKGWRGVIEVRFFKVQTSCGWGVPLMVGLENDDAKPSNNADTNSVSKSAAVACAKPPSAESTDPPGSLDDIRASVALSAEREKATGAATYHGPPYQPRVTLANFMAVLSKEDGAAARDYQASNNATSLDGLPGYSSARRSRLMRGSMAQRARNGGQLMLCHGQVLSRRLRGELMGLLLGLGVGAVFGVVWAVGWPGLVDMLGVGRGVGR